MLTFLHPETLPHIKAIPFGLIPFFFSDEEKPALVVKISKEAILASKINSGFKIYLAPVHIDGKQSIFIVSAFFDDADEPLTVITPLFDDIDSRNILSIIKAPRIKVHFFDELSREQLIYEAEVSLNETAKVQISEAMFTSFSDISVREGMQQTTEWFGLRGEIEDINAVNIKFERSLYGDGFLHTDMRADVNEFHGSLGYTSTILERDENPGQYQEQDIVQCLLSVFPGNAIYLNPLRTYDREEMCDILVVTERHAIIIQAKDSPNKKEISQQSIIRKKSSVRKHFKKAIGQVSGAISYYEREKGILNFYIGERLHSIDTVGLTLYSLVVVKELFNDMYDEYSQLLLELVGERAVPCIALDYLELYQYCIHTKSEDAFLDAYNHVFDYAMTHDIYPRLRFN